MIERAVEINAENDRLKGREKEVEEENVKHLQEREQLEKERLVLLSRDSIGQWAWEHNELFNTKRRC